MNKVAVVAPLIDDYTQECVRDSLSRGELAAATSSFDPSVMVHWLDSVDLVAVYLDYGLTQEMDSDMVKLQSYGKTVEYRRIKGS